jgi:hypothetical protein
MLRQAPRTAPGFANRRRATRHDPGRRGGAKPGKQFAFGPPLANLLASMAQ